MTSGSLHLATTQHTLGCKSHICRGALTAKHTHKHTHAHTGGGGPMVSHNSPVHFEQGQWRTITALCTPPVSSTCPRTRSQSHSPMPGQGIQPSPYPNAPWVPETSHCPIPSYAKKDGIPSQPSTPCTGPTVYPAQGQCCLSLALCTGPMVSQVGPVYPAPGQHRVAEPQIHAGAG